MVFSLFLQRLILDSRVGFNYDKMEDGIYELGTTLNGRRVLTEAFLDNDIVARKVGFVELYGNHRFKPVEVVMLSTQKVFDNIKKDIFECRSAADCCRTTDDNVVGWMNVGLKLDELDPLFMIKTSVEDASVRIDMFFKSFIEKIKEIRAEAHV